MQQRRVLFKSIQRRLYDLLLTRYGVLLILGGLLLVVVFALQLSDTILEYRLAQLKYLANVITLQNTSISLSISYHTDRRNADAARSIDDDAIDAVYTWVNGSDPTHLELIRKYANAAAPVVAVPKRVELGDFLSGSLDQVPCYHKLCVQSNQVLVVQPALDPISSRHLIAKYSVMQIEQHTNLSVVYLPTPPFELAQLNSYLTTNSRFSYKVYMAYYSIECSSSSSDCIHTPLTYILKKRKPLTPRQLTLQDRIAHINNQILVNELLNNAPLTSLVDDADYLPLPDHLNASLLYKFDYVYKAPASDGAAFDGSTSSSLLFSNLTKKEASSSPSSSSSQKSKKSSNADDTRLSLIRLKKSLESSSMIVHEASNITYDVYAAVLTWDLGDPNRDELGAHRFRDNDELKYSLRSLEKHAPWVRKVFLVTNGQVPVWLNLNNPRLHLVTHEDIFVNKSHLPTFSSPAIESHLHRIQGLSKRFLYFNDDTLLTLPVYPDDFYTQSRGFRFRLAWALPGCNPHCPQSWIGDGYCDRSCNSTECEWDGGDCDASAARRNNNTAASEHDAAREAFAQQSKYLFPEFYCSTGCSTSWLADKYCDNACNVKNCSYDMGDCGVEQYWQLYGVELQLTPHRQHEIYVPAQTTAFYVNFTHTNYDLRIVRASYDENQLVRQVSVVNKFSIMSVLLMPESYRLRVNLPNWDELRLHLTVNSSELGTFDSTILVKLNQPIANTTKSKSTTKQQAMTTDQASSVTTVGKRIEIRKIDLEPKKIEIRNQPSELTHPSYENKIFRDLYTNYYSYLNWSVHSGYLTYDGLVYKLNLLDSKIRSDFNITMENLNSQGDSLEDVDLTILSSLVSDLDKSVLIGRYLNETSTSDSSSDNYTDNGVLVRFAKRHLLDTFADSLKHVNRLYNQLYGYAARKVPAHMPHVIDRDIMDELQRRFPAEFERTSGARFRRGDDMQFAFSYYYYVMSEVDEFNATKLFDEYDLNANAKLDPSELMLMSLRMSDRPFTSSDIVPNMASVQEMRSLNPELATSIAACNLTETGVSRAAFVSCQALLRSVRPYLWLRDQTRERLKYRVETLGDEETKFIMIAGEPLDIEVKLANYMREPRKFLCLNDNIDYGLRNEAEQLRALLRQFFETMFPVASSFELAATATESTTPASRSNRHTSKYSSPHINLDWLFCVLIVVLICVCYFLYRCRRNKRQLGRTGAQRKERESDESASSTASYVLVNEKDKDNVSMRSSKAATSKKQAKKKTIVI